LCPEPDYETIYYLPCESRTLLRVSKGALKHINEDKKKFLKNIKNEVIVYCYCYCNSSESKMFLRVPINGCW